MPVIQLAKRSAGTNTGLIAAAVIACIAAALLTLGGLWFYHRWLVSWPSLSIPTPPLPLHHTHS
jgi:hypothetical protein